MFEVFIHGIGIRLPMCTSGTELRAPNAKVNAAFADDVNGDKWDHDRLGCSELDYTPNLLTRPVQVSLRLFQKDVHPYRSFGLLGFTDAHG